MLVFEPLLGSDVICTCHTSLFILLDVRLTQAKTPHDAIELQLNHMDVYMPCVGI